MANKVARWVRGEEVRLFLKVRWVYNQCVRVSVQWLTMFLLSTSGCTGLLMEENCTTT